MKAFSVQDKVLIQLPNKAINYRLERRIREWGEWIALSDNGFVPGTPIAVNNTYYDDEPLNELCQYRARDYSNDSAPWDFTLWMRRGFTGFVGYQYGNYKAPEGSWGEVLTTDDLRGYLWGVDFRASNGESYSDEQIKFFIDAALKEVERELTITIKKTRIKTEPERKGLKKDIDYDEAEDYYTFKRDRIQRNGMIKTRKRPVLSVSRLDLLNRDSTIVSLLSATTLDRNKGLIRFFTRMPKQTESMRAVEAAISPYGPDTLNRNLFYAIDYVAGYESSDDVPADLREVIGKIAAVSLMNIIGRGLMAGFSSSSLSLDGASESFSSTQCATSAFYGADIKEYKDDIEKYISKNQMKFGHVVLGAL
jgi:hypothetical protein